MIKEEKLMDFERLDLTELDKDLSEEQKGMERNLRFLSFKVGSYRESGGNGYYQRYFEKSRNWRSGT